MQQNEHGDPISNFERGCLRLYTNNIEEDMNVSVIPASMVCRVFLSIVTATGFGGGKLQIRTRCHFFFVFILYLILLSF